MADAVRLTIDGQAVQAQPGEKILDAALAHGITIPHLCARKDMPLPFGGCRLCFVEVEGWRAPVTACTEPVREGMVVRTRSERVDRLVRRAFELIISTHPIVCKNCPANRACALQDIAKQRKLPLKPGPLQKRLPEWPVDDSHPLFVLDPNLCILCGQCVHVCNEIEGARALDFADRGMAMRVSTAAGTDLAGSSCTGCLRCVEACPVGALARK